MRASLRASASSMRETGIPVQRDTTIAMSSSVTSSLRSRLCRCSFLSRFCCSSSSRSVVGIVSYRISAARIKSAVASAPSASLRSSSRSFFKMLMVSRASFSLLHFVSSTAVFSRSSPISLSISFRRSLMRFLCSEISSSRLSASFSISRRRSTSFKVF